MKKPSILGEILPTLIVIGAFAFPILQQIPTLQNFFGKTDVEVMRNLILTIAGGVTWLFLYRRAKAADKSAEAAEQNAKTTEQGVTVERLTRAIEQLASDQPSIILGGILGLKQIAESHEEELEKIVQILSTFIRERAPVKEQEPEQEQAELNARNTIISGHRSFFPRNKDQHIQTAVKTLAQIASKLTHEEKSDKSKLSLCNLTNCDLRGFEFFQIDFSKFNLTGTDLRNTILDGANLSGTHLFYTTLIGAKLYEANLSGAILCLTDLRHAQLFQADLSNTIMRDTKLSYTDLSGANLSSADMTRVNLNEADLSGANLKDVKNLTQQQLDEAYYMKGTLPPKLPDGLNPPPARDLLPEYS